MYGGHGITRAIEERESQGLIKRGVEFPVGDKEKILWNFHESWVSAMEFPSVKWCCSTVLRNLQGQSFAFSGSDMGMAKVTNLKIPGV